jgi:hypothetical protein
LLYTSSKGEFEEFHDQADVVEIGSILFNTKTNQMVGFVSEEKTDAEVSSATTAMSIDPLCEKYYWAILLSIIKIYYEEKIIYYLLFVIILLH